ncbi:MAG: alpha/beta hydrolase [Kiloniellales bacterium]|nr:alpha/beta hydrolase [Kiloniellales bacterium]
MTDLIYRTYDQADLDAQLNLRARWPDFQSHFDRWAEDSAAARGSLSARLDLRYGDTPGQTLDLFAAQGDGRPAPLMAFIHGGYWQALDKGDFSYLAPAFVEAGIAYASLNYDLAPGATLAEMVRQVRAALAWLYREADRQGLDRDRLHVSGHSAGGHLTAALMTTDWARDHDLPQDVVKSGCALSGIYDLEPIRLSYHQAVVALDPETVAAYSPIHHLPRQAGALLCAVGSEETAEFLTQQEEFVAAWRAAGLSVQTVPLPGRTHFTAVDALGEPDHPLFVAVRDRILGPEPTGG